MSDWMAGLADFHLLRPLWCLLLPVVAALWWWRRRIPADQLGGGHVAPHLADALRTDGNRRKRLSPVDTLALLACLLILRPRVLPGPACQIRWWPIALPWWWC